MIIVFISGLASGDVRLGTLTWRCLIAFCVSGAVVYFLLMIFEMYDENRRKKAEQIAKELAADEKSEENSENENPTDNDAAEGFQPINPSDIPRA